MKDKISIIGGDLRIKKLAEMLADDGITVYTYGLDKIKNAHECNSINELIESADVVIGPVPFSSNGKTINSTFSNEEISIKDLTDALKNKIFIAGAIKEEVYKLLENKNVEVIDLLKREELSVLNSISTAEGAIQIAIQETEITLTGSNILIMGFRKNWQSISKNVIRNWCKCIL